MKKILSFLLLTLILSACATPAPVEPTPDVNAVRTSAANTVVAEFTLTAASFSPTPEPLPTETPTAIPLPTETPALMVTIDPTQAALTPEALCDDYDYDVATLDVTIPDNTPISPGQEFVKTWKIKNIGICTWDTNYKAIFSYSNPPNQTMSAQPIPLQSLVAPGQEADVSVQFKAPTTPGEYLGVWQMVNAKGIPFGKPGKQLLVKIVVK
ncbi:MAG: lipoprotein [Anaerolineales bacterium]|nr:lipoprotein [Anaerolineales bacterium]